MVQQYTQCARGVGLHAEPSQKSTYIQRRWCAGIHIDDLLITSESDRLVNKLESNLRAKYGDITVKDGKVIDHVGITFDCRPVGLVKVTIHYFVMRVEETAATSTTGALFDTREIEMVTKHEIKWFRTYIIKILYLCSSACSNTTSRGSASGSL